MEKNGEVRSTWKYMLWGMDHCKFRFSLSPWLVSSFVWVQWCISGNLRAGLLVWDCLYSIVSLLLLYGKGIGDGVQQCLDASNLSFCLPLHVFMRSNEIEACGSYKGPMIVYLVCHTGITSSGKGGVNNRETWQLRCSNDRWSHVTQSGTRNSMARSVSSRPCRLSTSDMVPLPKWDKILHELWECLQELVLLDVVW